MKHNTATSKGEHGLELLAPAGSIAAFAAAMEAGADAVYVGAPGFNARVLAKEISVDEVAAMIGEAHRRQRKLYVAMNSLVKETELGRAIDLIAALAVCRPDALIVQDLGLAYLIRRHFPELPLHASTLMSVNTASAVNRLAELGFSRVVLARELSLEEIRDIAMHSTIDLEVFIHGAMCFSYSGLCLFSSMHGGKSSLRGQCVQPCRRRYTWQQGTRRSQGREAAKNGGYHFSMNDLCGLDHLDSLADTRVRSLKIEGRLKSAEYVRKTVAAYRLVLDSLHEPESSRRNKRRTAHRLLDQSMGRKRSSGYLRPDNREALISPASSGSIGSEIGQVRQVTHGPERDMLHFQVLLSRPVGVGDRIRCINEQSDLRKSLTLTHLAMGNRRIQKAKPGQMVTIAVPGGRRIGDGRQKASGFRLVLVDSGSGRQQERKAVLETFGAAPKGDAGRIANTLQTIGWSMPDAAGQSSTRGAAGKAKGRQRSGRGRCWWIKTPTLHLVNMKLPVQAEKIVVTLSPTNMELLAQYGDRLRRMVDQIVWAVPAVVQPNAQAWYRTAIVELSLLGFRQYQLAQIGQQGMFALDGQDGFSPIFYGDYTCNLLNSASLLAMAQAGFRGALFSLETDRENLWQALQHARRRVSDMATSPFEVGLIVYARPPLFTSRHAGSHFRYDREIVSPRGERFTLRQADDILETRAQVPFSLLDHIPTVEQAGIEYLILDLCGGSLRQELAIIRTLLQGKVDREAYMAGNFFAGLS